MKPRPDLAAFCNSIANLLEFTNVICKIGKYDKSK
jgi:hypothetical protein